MSEELSLYEALGGTYKSVDGILYPDINILEESEVTIGMVGKYGLAWISYIKENHADRYRHHIRMGQLHSKAQEVNEEAYGMLDTITAKYMAKYKPMNSNSTMEMWKLREQAKQLAEEVIYGEIVYQYH